ncbi:MAG: hypothetical protein Q9182_001567 [Xanthomendoza sp. 2 TL-2023]
MGIVSSSTSERPSKKSHCAAINSPPKVFLSSAAGDPARESGGSTLDPIHTSSDFKTDIYVDELSAPPPKAMKPSQLTHVPATPLKAAVPLTVDSAMGLVAVPPTPTTANPAKTHVAAIHAATTLTTPPATPSVARSLKTNTSSPAAQETPTRGMLPTRGMCPPHGIAKSRTITTSTPKRTRSPQRDTANHTPIKRLRLNTFTDTSPTCPANSNDNIHSTNCIPISPLEARRIREAVMRQIDWEAVAYHVATNGTERRYRRAVRKVFEEWETGLVAWEVCEE